MALRGLTAGSIAALAAGWAPAALAQAAPEAPASWWDTVKLHGQLEAGFTGNPTSPKTGLNFGQLFTDRSNQPLLNQLLLTAERPLDPKATGYDFGFKLQGMYGSDARYTHFLGELDRTLKDRNQLDIVEANLLAHLPVVTDGGIDLKFGQYSTPLGAEVIDASGNMFYSHSYIFNFGLPFKHTGGYATVHVNDRLDLYAGGDTGVNTSVGKGDNNGVPAFLGGFGLNGLLGGTLTVLALTHIGAENPTGAVPFNADSRLRYLNDVVITYKPSDTLTFITELNYIRDDGFHAQGYGIAQYGQIALNDQWSLGARAEVWRDDQGFFVAAFPRNLDFVNSERGFPATVIGGGRTTYGELTLGATFKPEVPKAIEGFMIRPEVRFDRSLSGGKLFNNGTDRGQVTLAADFVLPF